MKKSNYSYVVVEDIQEVCDEVSNRMSVFKNWTCLGLIAFFDEALQLILTQKPDLLFLDYSIRGGNSFDIIEAVNRAENYEPYIVFFTAYQNDQPEIPENAVNKYKVNKYMVKPIFEKLTTHLREYIVEAEKWICQKNMRDIWIETFDKKTLKIKPASIVCISQSPNSRHKIIHTQDDLTIEIKASWDDCMSIAQANRIDVFVANSRECIFNKVYISKIQKPFVYLNDDKIKVEISKNNWHLLEN